MSTENQPAASDIFGELSDLLLGGGGDDLITKMNPAGSDLSAWVGR
jgi:hypothetical protein